MQPESRQSDAKMRGIGHTRPSCRLHKPEHFTRARKKTQQTSRAVPVARSCQCCSVVTESVIVQVPHEDCSFVSVRSWLATGIATGADVRVGVALTSWPVLMSSTISTS